MKEMTDERQPPQQPEKSGIISQWAFRYRQGEGRITATLKSFLRIFFIIFREFNETSISLRAAALTYTVILSMVPILAMSTAILKGLGSDNQLRTAAYRLIDQLEPEHPANQGTTWQQGSEATVENSSDLTAEGSTPTSEETGAAESTVNSMTDHLRNAVDTIFNYVDRTNFAALGAFGIAGLLLTVVLVLSTVEDAMNAIWHTRESRSIFRKIMDYLALLILLPISINVAIAGDAILESPTILAHLHSVLPSEWTVRMLLKFLPFLCVILSLMVMYLFFPNIRVKTYAAFTGAIFAAVFWFLTQKAYIILQIGVSKYNAIYGSFATVPLFLVWVHLGWTFILLGASLAYAVQNRNLYYLPGTDVSPQKKLQLAFDILNIVYERFSLKNQTSLDGLIAACQGEYPGNIKEITEKLAKGGLLRIVDNNDRSFVPAAPSEKIEAREVVQLILGHETIPTIGGDFSHQVMLAAEHAIQADAFPVLAQGEPPEIQIEKDRQSEPNEQNEKTL